MKWEDIGEAPCSIARSLAVVGERWTILIIRNAFMGTRRFNDFQEQLNISRHRLSDRLSTLVEMGVMKKAPYQERPVRYEYRLTDMGKDWYQVQLAIIAWGDKWLSGENGPPMQFLHKPCGHLFTPTVVCSECGEGVLARDVVPMAGPGLKANNE